MISYINSPDAVAVVNAIDVGPNTRKYWNIFITDTQLVFILNDEVYSSLLWRMIPEARRQLIHDAPTLEELMPLDDRNFSIDLNAVKRLYIKDGGIFVRPTLHIELKNGKHEKWILFTRNRKENFRHIKGIELLNGKLHLEVV
ncbi:MAG: hypothetical protein ACI4LP_05780 [Anaerovoracaceae bacterium]